MKEKMPRIRRAASFLLAFGIGIGSAQAVTFMYNNSTNDLVIRFDPGLLEVGDEINFAGTSRILESWSFEYYAVHTFGSLAGTPQARARFYANNGPDFNGYATPGTLLWDSDWFYVPGTTDRSTFVFNSDGIDLPLGGLNLTGYDKITWSVQFKDLGNGDELGVDLYDPPVVGSSEDDYWEYDGSWALKSNQAGPMNFASVFIAVPDGGATVILLGIGLTGVGLAAKARRRR